MVSDNVLSVLRYKNNYILMGKNGFPQIFLIKR